MPDDCDFMQICSVILLVGKPNNLEDTNVEERRILKRVFNEYAVILWNGFVWLKLRTNGGDQWRGFVCTVMKLQVC